MTNSQQNVEHLFGAALDLPSDQRSAFLDRACHDSPDLRLIINELLAEDERAGSFLASPLLAPPARPAPVPQPSRFQPSQVIANRFTVCRFIARGGMGEVYEVEDRLLHGARVALKIIRPEIAADAGSAHRFEQEVLLARQVNHPNLCPIYELFRCEEPAPPYLFLTMKLLRGETLEARLRRIGVVPRKDALTIACELIDGIAAIHDAGIIHRDIKPSNVMLDQSGATHMVAIMDFGLARLPVEDHSGLMTSIVAGTPGYLAPELIQGFAPTQATDIYALGVVLHQVLTGERLSQVRSGSSSRQNSASRRGHSALKSADAPAHLVRAVTDFLSDDPKQRCRAFNHLRAHSATRPSTYDLPQLFTRRNFLIGAAASVCAVAGGLAFRPESLDDILHPLPSKRFVALLNWPPPSDARVTPMLLGLIDAIASELSHAEAFDHNFFVAAQAVTTDMTTAAKVNEVRQSLGANLVLATSGTTTPDHINLMLQVIDPASFRSLRTRTLHIPIDQQFSLPQRVVQAAADLLDVGRFSSNHRRTRFGTDDPQALAAFQSAEALRKKPNDLGLEDAIEKYKEAVEADPRFATAHARLGQAYMRLYVLHRDPSLITLARANAETALALDHDSIEGHVALSLVYRYTGASAEALNELALALALDPSDARTLTYQAQVYTDLNHWQPAEDAYKRVLKAHPNKWLTYNELGYTYIMQGKYKPALEAFEAAGTSAPRNIITLTNIGYASFLLGDLAKASTVIDKALAQQPFGPAFSTRADILRAQQKYPEALQASLDAVKVNPEESTNWLEAADAYTLLHRTREAEQAYQRAAQIIAHQLQVNAKDGPGWMLLALYQTKSGDNGSAQVLLKKAQALGADDLFSQLYKARVLTLLGQRDDALNTLADCIKRGATSTQINSTHDFDPLRSDPRFPILVRPGPGLLT